MENNDNAKGFAQAYKSRSFGMALYFGNESPLDIRNYKRDF